MTRLCIDCRQITWRGSGRCDECAKDHAEYVAEQNREWWT